ncbi:MAG: glutamate--tRNA ligase [Alphaproteobacteria bacterium]|nr:glutamate--tRNA ligase [Alphaproteobacteria bacterium]|tara:strand:+ start:56970 stop:58355 length:1386 start_codon:yes stop_codon:yes gene_type:complete
MTVVTRIAPSPTGFMHIGTARTALFSWLYAKRHNGKFLLRIEDTDRTRYSEEAVDALKDGLKWLGLHWDGDAVSQFESRHRHAEVAQQLVDMSKAYYCYCSPEELEQMREDARASGAKVNYDRRWRDRDASEAPEGVKPVVRIKAPLEGTTVIEDAVQGRVEKNNDELDDFILLRSDGTPTYMLSVVVDDNDSGVTHIIRGDDHLNNAFRQKVIIDAMGWDVPVYTHIPLILGPDGAKLSKRHGAQGVHEYEEMGYLPEAMRNYLLRLGWSHGDDEIISTEQAVEWFNLENIGKSAARFDFDKLASLNAHYIKQADNHRLLDLITPIMEKYGATVDDVAKDRLLKGMNALKDRAKTLNDIAEEGAFYAKKPPFVFTEKAEKNLDKDVLSALAQEIEQLSDLTEDNVQDLCKKVANDHKEGKLGKVAMPLRAALTGTTVSPSIFEAAAILGKDEVLKRLKFV